MNLNGNNVTLETDPWSDNDDDNNTLKIGHRNYSPSTNLLRRSERFMQKERRTCRGHLVLGLFDDENILTLSIPFKYGNTYFHISIVG